MLSASISGKNLILDAFSISLFNPAWLSDSIRDKEFCRSLSSVSGTEGSGWITGGGLQWFIIKADVDTVLCCIMAAYRLEKYTGCIKKLYFLTAWKKGSVKTNTLPEDNSQWWATIINFLGFCEWWTYIYTTCNKYLNTYESGVDAKQVVWQLTQPRWPSLIDLNGLKTLLSDRYSNQWVWSSVLRVKELAVG